MNTALVLNGHGISWQTLRARAKELAGSMAAAGVVSGELLAVHVGSGRCPELLHAARELGVALLPLNQRLTETELVLQLEDADPSWLLDASDHPLEFDPPPAVGRVRLGGSGKIDCLRATSARRGDRPPPGSLLLYTSGTSGRPKAAVLRREAFEWGVRAAAKLLGASSADRWLVCMPLFHVGGIAILLRTALAQSTAIVHPRFQPEAVSHSLDVEGVTHVSLVANMLERLIAIRGDRPAPPALQLALVGGGPTPAPLLEHARALGYRVAPTYGLTEACSQVASLPPAADLAQGLTPLPGVEIDIVDGDSRALAPGSEGEIRVRSGSLMDGYWQRPVESGKTLRNGALYTGDIGRVDEAGKLTVLDRRSDLIISGGENVYPAEIEAALLAHPDIQDAGVAGREDERFGARPHAWYVGTASKTELLNHCRGRLAQYKVPVAFERVAALPRSPSGKLLRSRLGAD